MNAFKQIALLALAAMGVAQGRPPNVVILFTDDQGTLDANCYGSKDLHTPNIDRLAQSGIRFTRAYAHTVCCPARAALLTGRHPQRGGVTNWTQGDMNAIKGINMALEEVTIAETLREAGYRTALFGKWHLGAHRDFGPKKQGFDEFFGIRDGFIDNYNHHFLHGSGFHDLYEGTRSISAPRQYFPELMVNRSLKFIEENKRRPFFLYVPFNIPHYPEQSLEQFKEPYANLTDPARKSYGVMISTTDYYIGKVIDQLKASGLEENTIVIFMSDNGHSEELGMTIKRDNHLSGLPKGHPYGASGGGNTGKWIGNKGTFLEGGIRVPAIISFPGQIPRNQTRDQAITAMDWFPTILDLCGIEQAPKSPRFDGHTLVPILKSDQAPSPHQGIFHFQWRTNWAVIDGDWKLLGNNNNQKVSLHSLAGNDPEKKDLSAEKPEIVAKLRKKHQKWLQVVSP